MSSIEEDSEKEEQELRLAFSHILKGCSEVKFCPPEHSSMYNKDRKEIVCFAKHFNFFDQINLDSKYQESFDKAKSQGLPTRKERLNFLDKSGDWTIHSTANHQASKCQSPLNFRTSCKAKL
jgi:hypothetical protein